MNNDVYIIFGDNLFKKLDVVKNNHNELQMKYNDYKVFSTLNLPLLSIVEKVFIGWSFILFKKGKDIYHGGFWKSDSQSQIHRIFPDHTPITDLTCGIKFSFMVLKNKDLYQFSNENFETKQIELPWENSNFVKIVTEDLYTVALTEDGKVFDVKLADSISVIPFNLPLAISEVSCGKEHVLLLSNSGIVFSYGIGSRGQLGHGNIDKLEKPVIVEALDGLKMKTVAAGGWHSAAISEFGDLYMWGWNESGQLGLPCSQLQADTSLKEVYTICCIPKIVELDDLKVLTVSCGSRHTAAITEDNSVWTWGWNNYGQLGNKNCLLSDKPEKVSLPDTFSPYDLKCKFWNTLIIGHVNQ